MTFTFRKVANGRREGGKCKPGTAKSKAKRCEIVKTIPVSSSSGDQRRERVPLLGACRHVGAEPGTYRLVGKAEGTAARSSYTTFKIVK